MSEKLLLLVLAYCLFKGIDMLVHKIVKLFKSLVSILQERKTN